MYLTIIIFLGVEISQIDFGDFLIQLYKYVPYKHDFFKFFNEAQKNLQLIVYKHTHKKIL